jgi:enamine deaminase RidA (YjgF/YER057c/UK114 family)
MSFDIFNPDSLGEPRGWNNGLVWSGPGRVLFVAGQAAADAEGRIVPGDFVDQFARALDRILEIVREAGGTPENIARLTIFITDMEVYRSSLKPLGSAYRERMGRHFPAMALVAVSELVDPEAVVEIEATAVLPPSD